LPRFLFFFGIYSVQDEKEFIYSVDFGYDRTFVTFLHSLLSKGDRDFFTSLLQQLQSGRFINWLISSIVVSPDLLLLKTLILDRAAFARLDQFSRLTDPSAVKVDDSESI